MAATMFSFAQGLGPLAIAPIFPQLVKDFHSDLSGVVHFTGVTVLVLGFSNFLWLVSIPDPITIHPRTDRHSQGVH